MLAETMADIRAGRMDPKLGSTLGYLGTALLRAFEAAGLEQRLERLEQRNELEKQTEQAGTDGASGAVEADCTCFPPDEPPFVVLRAEIRAVRAVPCPLHGPRFNELASSIYRPINLPHYLEPACRRFRSPQYVKAMEASFQPDRWPARKVWQPDGTVRFVLKDGTEIHRLPPPESVYDYNTGELIGFSEDYPPKIRLTSIHASEPFDWEQPA
jgi:hypothetical protein